MIVVLHSNPDFQARYAPVTAYVATTMGGPAAAREIARGWAFGADIEARRAAEALPLPATAELWQHLGRPSFGCIEAGFGNKYSLCSI